MTTIRITGYTAEDGSAIPDVIGKNAQYLSDNFDGTSNVLILETGTELVLYYDEYEVI